MHQISSKQGSQVNNWFYLQAQTLFDDPADKFVMAIERNDPASIDSLLRQQEVNVDQVLKVSVYRMYRSVYTIPLASFPGPTQLSIACSMEKQ